MLQYTTRRCKWCLYVIVLLVSDGVQLFSVIGRLECLHLLKRKEKKNVF